MSTWGLCQKVPATQAGCAGVTKQPQGFGCKTGSKDQPSATLPCALLVRIIDEDDYWSLLRASCKGENQSQHTGFLFSFYFR